MVETLAVAYEWLMPLAPWESPVKLHEAVASLNQQTWPARRLVVSVDGQLPSELAAVLQNSSMPVLVLQSSSWQGTGVRLAAGLSACYCEWVLRADADDRSAPHRAERQLSYLLEHPYLTVLGAQLSESSGSNSSCASRRVPFMPDQVRRMLSWWNPINHPTVALHRERVLRAGNYRGILNFEDWYLWLQLSYQGESLANLPDVLVSTEADRAHFSRRHGFVYAKRECLFFLRCCREGLIPYWRGLLLMSVRLPLRILPKLGLIIVMKVLRKNLIKTSDS